MTNFKLKQNIEIQTCNSIKRSVNRLILNSITNKVEVLTWNLIVRPDDDDDVSFVHSIWNMIYDSTDGLF